MQLFFKRLTGKLPSTARYEKRIKKMQKRVKLLQEIEQSEYFKEYQELHSKVNEDKFLAKKEEYTSRKYKDTEYYRKLTEFKKLSGDRNVKKYLKATSEAEQLQLAGNIAVKGYLRLKEEIETPEFKEKNAFWADKKRWEHSERGQIEARYLELKNSENIRFYLKADKRSLEYFESWQPTWNAPFREPSLEKNGFKAGFWFKQPELKRDFSYCEEAQAYMGDRNVNIQNSILSIITKKEHVTAPAWHEKKGFTMHDFDYTSAVINTGGSFGMAVGRFLAKVRTTGKCHSAIYLVGENRFPLIEMYHYNGKNIVVGITDKNGKEEQILRGIRPNEWYVMSVSVNRQEIIWKINDFEVFRCVNPMPGQNLYITCQSFAPKDKAGEGQLDIAWIRAFER